MCAHQLQRQAAEFIAREYFQQAYARGGSGHGQQKAGARIALQQQFGGAEKKRRHIIDFAHAAAGHQGKHGFPQIDFHLQPRGFLIGIQRQRLRHRVADKFGLPARFAVKRRFHRKQAQHFIHLMHNGVDPFAPPRPHRRAHIMQGGNAGFFQLFGHAQIKIGRINAHKHIGADALQFAHQTAADAQNFGQPLHHFGKAAHGQFFLLIKALDALCQHARPADADKAGIRTALFDGGHQVGAEQIARSLAGTQRDKGALPGRGVGSSHFFYLDGLSVLSSRLLYPNSARPAALCIFRRPMPPRRHRPSEKHIFSNGSIACRTQPMRLHSKLLHSITNRKRAEK